MPNYDPIYLSINNKPQLIISAMDELRQRHERQAAIYSQRRRFPLVLFLIGVPFFLIDRLLGYGAFIFGLVAIALWAAAIVVFFVLRRVQLGQQFSPHYDTAHAVVSTLRDDLNPKRYFFGHLDLTGPEQPTKLFHEGRNPLGLAVTCYRDEWLSLKARLYDGNMLRLSAIERIKVRKGYYKRGRISGKQKWKAAKYKNTQELKVRISVNPNVYDIGSSRGARVGARVGQYVITALDTRGGIIDLSASVAATTIKSSDILAVLRLAYSLLKRKASA